MVEYNGVVTTLLQEHQVVIGIFDGNVETCEPVGINSIHVWEETPEVTIENISGSTSEFRLRVTTGPFWGLPAELVGRCAEQELLQTVEIVDGEGEVLETFVAELHNSWTDIVHEHAWVYDGPAIEVCAQATLAWMDTGDTPLFDPHVINLGTEEVCQTVQGISTHVEPTNQPALIVYPNPWDGDRLFFQANAKEEYRLLDAAGRLVASGQVTETGLTELVSTQSKGLYHLVVESEKGTRTTKLIRD